jgi:ribosomal protein L37E
MRRGLAFASLFLLVVGLELSTEGISLAVARLRTGLGSLLTGTEFHVSALRFGVGLAALILGLSIWMLLIWSAHRRQEVATVGTSCPQCGNPTRRVKRREWQRLLSALLGEHLTRRRCETCGWSGLSLRY